MLFLPNIFCFHSKYIWPYLHNAWDLDRQTNTKHVTIVKNKYINILRFANRALVIILTRLKLLEKCLNIEGGL